MNRWFLFRKTFDLPETVSHAVVDIFVDSRYILYVNGHMIGRGPARSNPYYARYDRHEVGEFLHEGANAIAILVHVYGIDTAWYQRAVNYWQTAFGDGGVYCHLQVETGKTCLEICADDTWRCLQATAWRQDTPRIGWGQGFIEEYDARLAPDGWQETGFDDSDWPTAHILVTGGSRDDLDKGFHEIRPFPVLLPANMEKLIETPVSPVRVLDTFGLVSDETLPVDRRLYDESITSLPAGSIVDPDNLLKDDESSTLVRTRPGTDACILIAFEKIHAGYPFIELIANGGEVIEVAVAETREGEYSRETARSGRLLRKTFMDCAHLFRYIAKPGKQRFTKFEWTAVKYLQLVVRNAPDGVRIVHTGSIGTHYPLRQQGAFECGDDFLNRLWATGCYTIRQCSHDAWEDCPGREKRQWLGDGTVRFLAAYAAFGTSTRLLDRNYLLQCQESQRTDGLLQMFAPGDHHYDGMIIPDYSLYWILTTRDYHLYHDDMETIASVYPTVEKILAWFMRHLDGSDLLCELPYWHFIEWANTVRTGESATVNAMFAASLECACELARYLGYSYAEERYREVRSRVVSALNARHWNDAAGLYADSVDPATGRQRPGFSQHANAAMILWDIAPQERWQRMISSITDPDLLRLSPVFPVTAGDADFDRHHHIVQANTFFAHFVYSALAKAERFDLAMEGMRKHYGDMIERGAETLWESIEPTASLCHAFSATPVFQLSTSLLGITPLEPGFRRFRLQVQPADQTHASGIMPAPPGGIRVDWAIMDDTMTLTIEVPDGTACSVSNPPGFIPESARASLSPGKHTLTWTKAR